MHGSGPKLLIVAKKEAMGPDCADFGGDSFLDAKKKMVREDSEYGSDPDKALRKIAEELQKASKMHKAQADHIMGLIGDGEMDGDEGHSEDESDDGSYGEPHELE